MFLPSIVFAHNPAGMGQTINIAAIISVVILSYSFFILKKNFNMKTWKNIFISILVGVLVFFVASTIGLYLVM